MKTSPVGRSGVSVTSVGLGVFELGPESGEEPDPVRAQKVVAAALEAGVNWFDTSERYHDTRNETLIGGVRAADEMLVSTKVAPTPNGTGFRSPEVRAACVASLERLRREAIDIYFLHWPDETDVPLDETWGAMAELVDDGLVRAIGLSNYPLGDVERCHRQRPVDAIQDGLSLVDHLYNRDLFAACGELGIAGVVYEALGSGALSGRSIEAVREQWAAYSEWEVYKRLFAGENGDRTQVLVDAVCEVGERVGVSVPQLAVAWALAQQGVSAALVGTRSGGHLAENVRAAEIDLAEVMGELDGLVAPGRGAP